jgi:hypothetical protein
VTAPFDYLIVVFLSNSFYQNYLELSFSISTEFGAESKKDLLDEPGGPLYSRKNEGKARLKILL